MPHLRLIPTLALPLALTAVSAQAVPVTPVIVPDSGLTTALTVGAVPGAVAVDADSDPAASSAFASAANNTGPADTTEGSAQATIDATDINLSSVGSRSFVGTDLGSPVAPNPAARDAFNLSFGSLGATLSTVDLAPGDVAEVDLTLNFEGSIIYRDPTGSAGENVASVDENLQPIFIPDISGSVSLLMDVSNLVSDIPVNFDGTPDLSALTFVPLFNGSLTLESVAGVAAPLLTTEGDFDLLDYIIAPGCTAFFCQVDVAMSRTFNDVQSLGLGDEFEVGLFVLTDAQSVRDPGRSIDVDFMNTASVDVNIETAEVPAPAPLVLLLTGLLGCAARRRGDGNQRTP